MRHVLLPLAFLFASACGGGGGGTGNSGVGSTEGGWWDESCYGGSYGEPGCSTEERPWWADGDLLKLSVSNHTPCVWTAGTLLPWSRREPIALDLLDPIMPGEARELALPTLGYDLPGPGYETPDPGYYDIQLTGYHSVTYEAEAYLGTWSGGLFVIE